MKLKINYLNTINYSLIRNGLEETSYQYSKVFQNIYPSDKVLYKTLTKVDQLITLANSKRKLNNSDRSILLPLLNLTEEKIISKYLIDSYQTKQYVRVTTINELTSYLQTKKGYSRLMEQIEKGDDGLDFKKYIQKSKQVAYIRNSKLLIVIFNSYLLKTHIQFDPIRWDATSLIDVMKSAINDSFEYTQVTNPRVIKNIANDYSNSKAESLKKQINEQKNREDRLLSSLRATFEQFTSLNKL